MDARSEEGTKERKLNERWMDVWMDRGRKVREVLK